ncbi:MAG TPA: alkaline phosphatase family protein, partial [Vicinamibacterales bacterium]|nr:alkaline phosphatase family protein [Vicinamibacterales bacterium]
LGHAVSVMTSALVVASGDEAVARKGSWRTSLATGAAALGVAALLLTSVQAGSGSSAARAAALTVVPSGLRVRVIAIDGFDPRIFGELSSAGRVPSLAAAFNGAVVALEAHAEDASDPARVWTTIATGQPASVHGVQALETRRVAGVAGSMAGTEQSTLALAIRGATDFVRLTRPAIASGNERRAKTFWEVAADAGLRTAVVNWWATWPARADSGIVLSDRATLRLEHGGTLDAEVAPPSLYEGLRARYPAIKGHAAEMTAAALETKHDSTTGALLERSAQLDALQLVLLSEVAGPDTDLSVAYLPGLDIAQHTLLGGDRAGLAASALGARLDALKDYYATLDRLLARAAVLHPQRNELVIVLTEPGRVSTEGGARMAVQGAAVSPPRSTNAPATGVAATILYALGVPVARDLASPAMADVFNETFRRAYPLREVSTYGPPIARPAARDGQPLDQEMIDRLRSLGYVR